jgi:outer membrane beta-barrel protein
MSTHPRTWIIFVALSLAPALAGADEQKPMSAPQTQGNGQGERLDVDKIRRNYWNRGEENDTRVVQNRMYSTSHKFEFGIFGASLSGDPFLTSKSLGVSLGYHFTEYLGLFGNYWTTFTTGSSAEDFLEQSQHIAANTNMPRNYKGGEVMWSPVYGKLSLLGEIIIHYDMHVLGGLGMTGNETANQFTISGGIGQQVYVNRWMSIRFDYRLMRFDEDLVGKDPNKPASFGKVLLTRTNYTDVFALGLDFLLPP